MAALVIVAIMMVAMEVAMISMTALAMMVAVRVAMSSPTKLARRATTIGP